jgi:hypothetical protein
VTNLLLEIKKPEAEEYVIIPPASFTTTVCILTKLFNGSIVSILLVVFGGVKEHLEAVQLINCKVTNKKAKSFFIIDAPISNYCAKQQKKQGIKNK